MERQFLEKVLEIIENKFQTKPKDGKLILQDGDCKPIEIKKSGLYACFDIDKGSYFVFPFYDKRIPNVCVIADNLIFYTANNQVFVFIIELKTNSTSGSKEKITATHSLSKYICETVIRLLKFRSVQIEYRGLLFSRKGIKGTTKPKNLKYYEYPETHLKYMHLQDGQTILLNSLTF